MDFGSSLRKLRINRNLSQRQLAAKSGMSNTQVWRLEKGERKPSLETLDKLSRGLGVPLSSLMSDAGYLLQEEPGFYLSKEMRALLSEDPAIAPVLKALSGSSDFRRLAKELSAMPPSEWKRILKDLY